MGMYLDYNASAPIDERVLETMIDVYRNSYGNADSRTHDYGDQARSVVENARKPPDIYDGFLAFCIIVFLIMRKQQIQLYILLRGVTYYISTDYSAALSFVRTDTPVSVTSPPRSSPLIACTAAFTPSLPITSGFCAIVA